MKAKVCITFFVIGCSWCTLAREEMMLSNTGDNQNVSINNGKPTSLTFLNNGRYFKLSEDGSSSSRDKRIYFNQLGSSCDRTRFIVLNQLLIIGNKDIESIDWAKIINVSSSYPIARFKQQSVILVPLLDWDIQGAIDRVEQVEAVHNVQPDMIQHSIELTDQHCANNERSTGTYPSARWIKLQDSFDQYLAGFIDPEDSGALRMAIIDDGFDLTHPSLKGANVTFQYDVETGEQNSSPKHLFDNHGTMMLSVIYRKVKQSETAEFTTVRIVSAQTSKLVLAMAFARANKAHVINMSFRVGYLPEPLRMLSEYTDDASKPPILIVSAGNNAQNACEDNKLTQLSNAISVGDHIANGQISQYSNYGECVDVLGPRKVLTLSSDVQGGSYVSGSSVAAAWIAGELGYSLLNRSQLIND